MKKVLMKGNEAIALAAIKGGCEAFFGYPITPQNELPEYLAKYMRANNKVFLQAESEVAAINMVYGASAAGKRVLTSSSSPGIALKQEGISYLVGSELPSVIINVMRAGPGLGGIQPAQSDYNQITRGGGNGDYHILAYAPENLQETVDLVQKAFLKADYYRNPVIVAVDGLIGQMMEPVTISESVVEPIEKPWAADGKKGGEKRVVNSLYLDPYELEKHNLRLNEKYQEMKEKETLYEQIDCEDAEIILVAYGTMARICRSAIELLREENIKAGLIRPITLWPFPFQAFQEISPTVKGFLTCEMSLGQMVDDVSHAVSGKIPVAFYGRSGGVVPEPIEIVTAAKKLLSEVEL
ncbi:MAG: 3-methyl-2-oxobutanoate dehydrogenase subunit VorB [Acholeplasmataceae bacterium]|jgi:2-oxoglutarate ferredoxin oxidoreductase subunit alpha|nr:3-methyl-2-oxobutanoate dehydrogenase subunit VorB [Acholeplasmataceae bacterium]